MTRKHKQVFIRLGLFRFHVFHQDLAPAHPCTWDPPCVCVYVWDKIGMGGAHPAKAPGDALCPCPGPYDMVPTLLCSRSLHSSRAAVQDHHRDHRGGAVGALLILLRRVGDQLYSKGNPTCQPATWPSVECPHPPHGIWDSKEGTDP